MSERITKDPREYISRCEAHGVGCGALDDIADQIDADHERAVEKAHCEDISDIGDDELSSLYGLVRLPVDADGKVIRPGDLMVAIHSGNKVRVTRLVLGSGGWTVTASHGCFENSCTPSELRHPTPAERIRSAVRTLTSEGGDDGSALKSLMDIADELEGDE